MIQQPTGTEWQHVMVAALGMASYGLYSMLSGVVDMLGSGPLKWWADLWLVVAGAALGCGAVFVRASMPDGLVS